MAIIYRTCALNLWYTDGKRENIYNIWETDMRLHSHHFILIDLYHIHTVQYAQDRSYGTYIIVVHFAVAGIAVRLQ